MPFLHIEAYDSNDKQILGNCDGQGVLHYQKSYKRGLRYKNLHRYNSKVAYYTLVTPSGEVVETIYPTRRT